MSTNKDSLALHPIIIKKNNKKKLLVINLNLEQFNIIKLIIDKYIEVTFFCYQRLYACFHDRFRAVENIFAL